MQHPPAGVLETEFDPGVHPDVFFFKSLPLLNNEAPGLWSLHPPVRGRRSIPFAVVAGPLQPTPAS